MPVALLAQARLAASNGVSLDKVLRRYFLGYLILGDFVVAGLEATSRSRPQSIKGSLRIEAVAVR